LRQRTIREHWFLRSFTAATRHAVRTVRRGIAQTPLSRAARRGLPRTRRARSPICRSRTRSNLSTSARSGDHRRSRRRRCAGSRLPGREHALACEVRLGCRGSRWARVVLRAALRFLRRFECYARVPENPSCRRSLFFAGSSLAIHELCQVCLLGPLRFVVEVVHEERVCYCPSGQLRHEAGFFPSRKLALLGASPRGAYVARAGLRSWRMQSPALQ
jgi:hypothetical protein